ncbi:ABC transporter ATP-binding protein, partial [Candidatus Bathyarchaeota archaeon]|nr:ABC transporter ATP-binding protein [Candidatus Bathyarchaeota archaeon]
SKLRKMTKKEIEEKVHEAVRILRIENLLGRKPSELSGGQMQRVAMGRAIVREPQVFLMDEPLSNLDAKLRTHMRTELRRLKIELGVTTIYVTHDQAEAMAISDRIAVIRKGKILQVGTPTELYMTPKNVFVAHFIGESNFLEGYVSSVNKEGVTIELRGGIKVQAAQKNVKGERVVLAIRPETVVIEKSMNKKNNFIQGVIERTTFEGNNMRYDVRLENEDLIVVVKPSLVEEWLNVGEKVTISFSPGKTKVFAYPEAGLREEIAVE